MPCTNCDNVKGFAAPLFSLCILLEHTDSGVGLLRHVVESWEVDLRKAQEKKPRAGNGFSTANGAHLCFDDLDVGLV